MDKTIKSSEYMKQSMLIENNVTPEEWFIWHNHKMEWVGKTKEAGELYASTHGIHLDWIEPLGSEPTIIDDE